MTVPGAKAMKAVARAEALVQRKDAHRAAAALVDDANRHLLSALARHHGRVIAGYLPMRTEIDPLPAMAHLAEEGPVVVPVVRGAGQPLAFRRWTPGCALIRGAFGAMIPETGEELDPDALIVPVVAFDGLGHRLGYGGGFYDRTLTALRARHPVLAVGFAYSGQAMAALPVEATDAKLDMVVTERGVAVGG
jgi:5-formyltetrahydrofolate cyclo-ligase